MFYNESDGSLTRIQLVLFFGLSLGFATQASPTNSVARIWDECALAAIRTDTPNPPAQARNLFGLAVCMYDAWAAYDTNGAVGYVYHGKQTAADVVAARNEAISYAAWHILKERHAYSVTASNSLVLDDIQMAALGYDTNNASRDTTTPAGLGNTVYDAVSAWFINDGARQTNGIPYPLRTPPLAYPDYPVAQGGYVYINPPLATSLPGIDDGSGGTNGPGLTVVDINQWQRLQIVNAVSQNGIPQGPLQKYLGPQWLGVRPFALVRTDPTLPWIDPGPPAKLGGVGDADFRSSVVELISRSSELTPDDGVMIDISPSAFGNNTLGANDGTGHPVNPATGQPYPPNVVQRGDFERVSAEFWADGPGSETPPGHWNLIANWVSDNTNLVKRIGGTGHVLDNLEWDVKLYFALNAALHDAACAAWSLKRYYDGWRPLSAVRYMALHGQSSDPSSPSYNTNGLPLISGLIELVTTNSVASERHAGLTVGTVAVYTWPGGPTNPVTQYSGVKWIEGESWLPYQKATFVTPAFPGYISGHSTFSRAAAEILTAITGSPYFPGGLYAPDLAVAGTTTGLAFESGPSQPVQLQCATYYDASDQAGRSRVYGGIHPSVDDFPGRRVGSQCGLGVWSLEQRYFDGSIARVPFTLTIQPVTPAGCALQFNTVRGFYYKLQSTPDLLQPFNDVFAGTVPAFDTSMVLTDTIPGTARWYRIVRSGTP